MSGLQLIATGGAIPGWTVTNEDLSRMVDTSDEWITSRTGIRTRHWCTEDESAATLAIAAARQALDRSGLAPADIACCVCATLSAPDATPSVACQVQAALGLPENRPALDINAACSGFLYGMAVARGMLTTLGGQYALVIGCEALSRLMDPTDRSTCVLFGDGAGAAIFRAAEGTGDSSDTGILATKIYADGSQYDHLCSDGGVSLNQKAGFSHMDGKEVFKVAIPSLVQGVEESLKIAGININEVNWYVPHQANLRIIDSVAKKLEIDMDKVVVTVDHHGNTSAASIPLALAESFAAGKFKKGDVIAISAMGAGFTWGGMVIRI